MSVERSNVSSEAATSGGHDAQHLVEDASKKLGDTLLSKREENLV